MRARAPGPATAGREVAALGAARSPGSDAPWARAPQSMIAATTRRAGTEPMVESSTMSRAMFTFWS